MFSITAHRGVPVVFPSKTPERMRGSSASRRAVDMGLFPGARRAISARIKSISTPMPGGTCSNTTPMAGPWDSPKMICFMESHFLSVGDYSLTAICPPSLAYSSQKLG